MDNINVGMTYLSDHVLANGKIPESALDHVYISNRIKSGVKAHTLENSSTDHVPVIIRLTLEVTEKQICAPHNQKMHEKIQQ
jgi:endonuclease/exonuclease/phosphatase family metal-dependent hydrolase